MLAVCLLVALALVAWGWGSGQAARRELDDAVCTARADREASRHTADALSNQLPPATTAPPPTPEGVIGRLFHRSL